MQKLAGPHLWGWTFGRVYVLCIYWDVWWHCLRQFQSVLVSNCQLSSADNSFVCFQAAFVWNQQWKKLSALDSCHTGTTGHKHRLKLPEAMSPGISVNAKHINSAKGLSSKICPARVKYGEVFGMCAFCVLELCDLEWHVLLCSGDGRVNGPFHCESTLTCTVLCVA